MTVTGPAPSSRRSAFLPHSFVVQESAGSWEHGKTAAVLLVWTVVGAAVAARTFRWQRDVR